MNTATFKIGDVVLIKHAVWGVLLPPVHARVEEAHKGLRSGTVRVLDGPAKGMTATITEWPDGLKVLDGNEAHDAVLATGN